MRVQVTHNTRLDYDGDVTEGVMDVRLGPMNDTHQRWESHNLHVSPSGTIRRYVDGFRNEAHIVTVPRVHRYVEVVSSGIVETLLDNPFAIPTGRPRPLSEAERFDYQMPSQHVTIGEDVMELAAPHRPSSHELAFDAVAALNTLIYQGFTYEKDVTSISTTVGEVIESRRGVCQDFAHLLLALCRTLEIPARYVSGDLVSDENAPELESGPTRGARASHAWVEAWSPTHGWRGFDPTNNVLASERHVKMAIGRDYADVPPSRGVYRGSAPEKLTVDVTTKVLD